MREIRVVKDLKGNSIVVIHDIYFQEGVILNGKMWKTI